MSVIVKMEMPHVCITDNGFYGYCPMDRVWCIQRNAPSDITMREAYEAMTDKIPPWCPIICELPEKHGRLVDADALIARLHETYLYDDNARSVIYRKIEEQPTLVPAERRTE